jgi:hypothetical protein
VKVNEKSFVLGSAAIGMFAGISSVWLPWYLAIALCSMACCVCGFLGMLIGYSDGCAMFEERLAKLIEHNRELGEFVSSRGAAVARMITSTAKVVSARVAFRMVEEVFKNARNEEHREAALKKAGDIVGEEIRSLEDSIQGEKK